MTAPQDNAPGRVNLTSRQLELLLALVMQEAARRGWDGDRSHLAQARGVLASADSEEFAMLDFLMDDELHRRQRQR